MNIELFILGLVGIVLVFLSLIASGVFKWFDRRLNTKETKIEAGHGFTILEARIQESENDIEKIKFSLGLKEARHVGTIRKSV